MKKWFKYIKFLLTIVVILLFGIYIYRNPEILTSLKGINPLFIVITMILFLIVFLLEGLFVKITLQAFDKDITVKESFYIATISRIGNYLLPMRAGAIFRATYLKNKYSFEYSKFLSTLYGYYIILFLVYSSMGILSLIIKWIFFKELYLLLLIFFSVLFITMLLLMFVRVPNKRTIKTENNFLIKISKFFQKFGQGWDTIVKNKKLLKRLILVTVGHIIINTIIIYVEFIALNITIDIPNLLLYSSLSGASLLISLTPGSLGIREGVFLITSQSIGLVQEQILQLAIIDRGIMFILLILMMIFVSIFLKEFNLKDAFFAKKEN
ncbi:MAG: lysylphosphatidylglycerol synthase transmembrane domain-containing protein [Candidatus Dojkabacteria bacterium]|nr:lysylphosphatidylglycerol synthase transmembrane domain-containing protein [Candidatus Dojkabacteria bacterium]